MRNISSFGLQYTPTYSNVSQGQATSFSAMQSSPYDLIITDGAPGGAPETATIDDTQLHSLQQQGRTVVGYVNVSVTDDNRAYWKSDWTDNHHDTGTPTSNAPDWLLNSQVIRDGDGNVVAHLANYELASWQKIVVDQAKALVTRGYDGVFLDDVDQYSSRTGETVAQRASEMIDLIKAVTTAIHLINSNAYVVVNGGAMVAEKSANATESQKFFGAIDTMLLENPDSTTMQYALANLQGQLPLLTLFSADSDAAKLQEAMDAYAHGLVPYVAPSQGYTTLGTFVNPGTAGNDTLTGGDGPNRLNGLGGNDTIFGLGGDDTLHGGDGDDVLVGGPGNDTLNGDAGVNAASYADAPGAVQVDLSLTGPQNTGNAGTDTLANIQILIGSAFGDTLKGGTAAETLIGGAGNDTLQGGSGAANTLQGGPGNDTYVVAAAGDSVIELAGEGTDLVQTALGAFTLPANVENLTYTGAGAFTGVGNGDANAITGGSGADTLIGKDGDDTLSGGSGAANTLQGGPGNDTYIVAAAGDSIGELAGEGTDLVRTALASFTLQANVENLTYTGAGGFTGVGNGGDNVITGGAGADYLIGAGGNDTLIGGTGAADTLQGGTGNDIYVVTTAGASIVEFSGEGTDQVRTSLASYTLQANVENLTYTGAANFTGAGNASANTIIGGAGADYLIGFAGDDVLIGGAGAANTLQGGTGDDIYAVEAQGDSVIEAAGEGNDQVQTNLAAFTLSANIEKLIYTGAGNFTGAGNAGANTIIGGSGADYLIGGGGDDTLIGGAGKADTLQGGAGNDIYAVESVGDSIIEFAGEGTDQVQTNLGSFTLAANVENLTYTGAGNFTGTGNGGDNVITGGHGNDTLTGAGGEDRFVFTSANGVDTIMDFAPGNGGNDIVELHAMGVTNYAALQGLMTTSGGDTVITFDASDKIVLHGVLPAQLNSGDFVFT